MGLITRADLSPRLKVMYVAMEPLVPARSGYAVRWQTLADVLSGMADFRALVLHGEVEHAGTGGDEGALSH